MKAALDNLYAAFNAPESARDPIQIVRRYPRVDDREVVAFIAAGLAFGRVASVMQSIEGVCDVMGAAPATFLTSFDPARDGTDLRHLVHRWIRGEDLIALLWVLRQIIVRHGSLERAIAPAIAAEDADVAAGLEAFAAEARAIDLRPAYGRRVPARPGVHYFFTRPSSGSACKRMNLFLRWMVRRDDVDPGGWTSISPRQLIVPLDTHTIRVGRCLKLTRRSSPGWKMAEDITRALRAFDPEDPVRYDFALCHLSMMGACGNGSKQRDTQCPLRGVCKPRRT